MSFTNGTAAVIVGDDDPILFSDPIAMDLYGGPDGRAALSGLGLFPDQGTQLGLFGIDDALLAAVVPGIIARVRGATAQHVPDPVGAVWQGVQPDEINAYVGPDGWWYDNDDRHRLSNEEADYRQQSLVAATIGMHVQPDGWWYDDFDNHRGTHAEAWSRYQQLAATGDFSRAPVPEFATGPGGQPLPTTPIGRTPKTALAGLGTMSTPLLIGGAVILAALLLSGRRAAR